MREWESTWLDGRCIGKCVGDEREQESVGGCC
jgi:hypothetical protein